MLLEMVTIETERDEAKPVDIVTFYHTMHMVKLFFFSKEFLSNITSSLEKKKLRFEMDVTILVIHQI